MNETSVTFFGVGDGWPCDERKHSAFLYRFGQTRLLIDCGEPVSGSYKATGLSYDAIDGIFISHLNFDHIAGFFMLLQGFWLEQRKSVLPVHLPAEGIEPIRRMLEAGYVFDELLPFKLQFAPLKAGQAVVTGEVKVTAFPTTHLDHFRRAFHKKHPVGYEAFSFLLEAGRLRIAHSADLGVPEDLAPLLEKPLDLLVCELAHFKAEDLFGYLRGRAIKRIAFIHLARAHWNNLKKIHRQAEKQLGGIPFSFAQAGEEMPL